MSEWTGHDTYVGFCLYNEKEEEEGLPDDEGLSAFDRLME